MENSMKDFDEYMKELNEQARKREEEHARELEKIKEQGAKMQREHEERMSRLAEEFKQQELAAKEAQKKREQELNDQLAWYKFIEESTKVINGQRNVTDAEYKEVISKMESVRRYLNQEGNSVDAALGSYLEGLAKSDQFDHFPRPTDKDKNYAKFYNTLNTMRSKSLLAHRFDFAGRTQQDGFEFNLHLGNQSLMIPQMASSFNRYLKENRDELEKQLLLDPEFKGLDVTSLDKVLNFVAQDVNEAIYSSDVDSVKTHAKDNQVLLLAPSLKTSAEGWHAISVAMFNDICLIADKDRPKDQGVEIFQLGADAKTREQVATDIANKSITQPGDPITSIEAFTEDLKKKLKMKKIGHIPLQAQFGENCTWSSCSKSVLLSALYARFYQAAINMKKEPKEAQRWAQYCARLIQKDWAREDKFSFLKAYVAQYDDPSKKHLGPDPVLLAYIKLKYQLRSGNEHIVAFIDSTGLVKDEQLRQAKEMAYKRAETMLQEEYPIIHRLFPLKVNEISKRFADLYLLTSKSHIDKVFSSISFVSLSPFKNIIDTLDKAILEAQKAPIKEKRAKSIISGAAYAKAMPALALESEINPEPGVPIPEEPEMKRPKKQTK